MQCQLTNYEIALNFPECHAHLGSRESRCDGVCSANSISVGTLHISIYLCTPRITLHKDQSIQRHTMGYTKQIEDRFNVPFTISNDNRFGYEHSAERGARSARLSDCGSRSQNIELCEQKTKPKTGNFSIIFLLFQLLVIVFQFLHRMKGIRSSGLLTIFWFVLALLGVLQFRSEVMRYDGKNVLFRTPIEI